MKKTLSTILFTIISLNICSQISFEKGHFINNNNEKINCFIKNIDWKNNPTEFEYQISENNTTQKTSLNEVKEFSIGTNLKYVRFTLNIDKSSQNINELSTIGKPIFKEETLFLKVLLEGKANLFSYENGNLKLYFYNVDNSKTEQLIYKQYKSRFNQIAKNTRYKNQIWNALKCESFKMSKVENLDYRKNDLVNIFESYNTCKNNTSVNFEKGIKKDLFNLNLRFGYNFSNLNVENTNSNTEFANFRNGLSFRFGIEAEFILPFNKNKWAVILEPTYQYFTSKDEASTQNAKLNFSAIELPIGIRHYFFINDDAKIFVNGSIIFKVNDNSNLTLASGSELEIQSLTNSSIGLGAGFNYKDRFSLEVRYQSIDGFSEGVPLIYTNNTLSAIFAYSLF
jgi:hypothetical protein